MKKMFLIILCCGLVGIVGLTGCTKNEIPNDIPSSVQNVTEQSEIHNDNEVNIESEIENETPTQSGIVINEIENLASAKIMAESKVIEKENLPEDLKHIAELSVPDGLKLSMISELYTKSDMTKEEFDVLHDYNFLYSDDEEKNIAIHVSKEGEPLRDYFFQASNNVSIVEGVEMVISRYENKMITRFNNQGVYYDIETNGVTEDELVEIVKDVFEK